MRFCLDCFSKLSRLFICSDQEYITQISSPDPDPSKKISQHNTGNNGQHTTRDQKNSQKQGRNHHNIKQVAGNKYRQSP